MLYTLQRDGEGSHLGKLHRKLMLVEALCPTIIFSGGLAGGMARLLFLFG